MYIFRSNIYCSIRASVVIDGELPNRSALRSRVRISPQPWMFVNVLISKKKLRICLENRSQGYVLMAKANKLEKNYIYWTNTTQQPIIIQNNNSSASLYLLFGNNTFYNIVCLKLIVCLLFQDKKRDKYILHNTHFTPNL